MKRFLTAAICAALLFALSGCSKKAIMSTELPPEKSSSQSTRSVYIYMCGGDTEKDYGSASQVLRDMTKAEYKDDINIIVQTGGSTIWREEGISSNRLDRFEVHNGKIYKTDSVQDANMGESKTLIDFLKWGNEKYPAKSRMVIIWGQGGGCVGGTAYDARHDYDSLTPGEVAYALSRTGVNYDMVGFDACMMSTLETASAIAPYASFMTASEEYQPCSWNYKEWLKYMADNPSASADIIGRKICESYYNKCVDLGQDDTVSIAVTDLSKISTLSQAFDGLSGKLTTVSDSFDSYRDFAFNMKNIHLLGGKNEDEGYSNMIDLDDFAKQAANSSGYDYEMIGSVIKDAVVYHASGLLEGYTCGLGIFYPIRQNRDELKKYFDISQSSNYTSFLRAICTKTNLDERTPEYKSSWAWSNYINERGYFQYGAKIDNNCYELNINGNMDIVKNVSLNLYRRDKNEMYLYTGSDCGMDIDRDAGIYKDNGDISCLKINGNIVTAYLIDKGENYFLYSIPVYINNVPGSIRAALINRNGKQKFKTYGFWKGIKVAYGLSDRKISKIHIYDKIEPFAHEYKSGEYYKSKPFHAWFMSLKKDKIPTGEYKLEYMIEDIYNDIIKTDPSDMTVSGGSLIKY